MPSPRRTPRSGPGGSRRPGAPAARSRPRSAAGKPPTGQPGRGGAEATTGPRFTGRAVVLVLVLAVLAVSYASSMRAYLTQRAHIGDLKERIVEREAAISDLEREKRRWDDPAYLRTQARERFGYLMPGETGYQLLDEDGEPLEGQAELSDPDDAARATPSPWWSDAWDSVELAGHPPKHTDEMSRLVDGTQQ